MKHLLNMSGVFVVPNHCNYMEICFRICILCSTDDIGLERHEGE